MVNEQTQYGFRWGPLEVQRACADGRYHTLFIKTSAWDLQISVSPSGKAVHVVKLKRPKPLPKYGCAGCGFPHVKDYPDCVWNKSI